MGEYPALSEDEIALISAQRGEGYFTRNPDAVPSPELLARLTA